MTEKIKMRVPTLVDVLGTYYSIEYHEDLGDLHGEALVDEKIIKVCTGSHHSKEDIRATIFHETLHAVLWVSGINSVIGDSDKEEGIIRAIENSMKKQIKITCGIYSDFKSIELNKKRSKE